jgi:RNA polymerase subunit RPABC4/transcription elongation factor Spt4
MRERHLPRVCRSCQAPMARQEDTCWRCGARWASEDTPRTTLHVITGGARTHVAAAPDRRIAVAVGDNARAATEAHLDADRWMNEGGSFDSEATGALRAATERR